MEEIEEKCLKKSKHFPAKEAIYETPSDYDPLALNMGQLVVHRISLRFSRPINMIFNIIIIVVLIVMLLSLSLFFFFFIDIDIIVIMMIRTGEQVQM